MQAAANDEPVQEQPNLGHLLLSSFRLVVDELFARLALAGYTDLRPAHSRVFENLRDEGVRVSELAERAQMTHQSMSELILHLEQCGYVERHPDPTDRRAKVIMFTAKGHELSRRAAACIEEIEGSWQQQLGARRYQQLRSALAQVTEARGSAAPGKGR